MVYVWNYFRVFDNATYYCSNSHFRRTSYTASRFILLETWTNTFPTSTRSSPTTRFEHRVKLSMSSKIVDVRSTETIRIRYNHNSPWWMNRYVNKRNNLSNEIHDTFESSLASIREDTPRWRSSGTFGVPIISWVWKSVFPFASTEKFLLLYSRCTLISINQFLFRNCAFFRKLRL